MKSLNASAVVTTAAGLGLLASIAFAAQDRYALRVPNGLAFSEFRGYEGWSVIAVSEKRGLIAVILGNPVVVDAYKSGIPGNGKPFPDGSKMAKIRWNSTKNEADPGQPMQPGTLHDVDFMVKDHNRFADGGGWGWAVFKYEPATDGFRPSGLADEPSQGNDAKCGLACHTMAKSRDYVFTAYPMR